MTDGDLRQPLRARLRARRRSLSPQEQQQAALLLVRQLLKMPQLLRAQHIALYSANDGEIDPEPLARQLWKMGKHTYLPVLRPDKPRELWFVAYGPDTPLTPNRFGIAEPDFRQAHRLPPHLLDMALMPLVGFDRQGTRLGMGGGFYDRTFAFKQQKPKGKPYLVGLAHSCQEEESLATASWDIPLFALATEQELILCAR
ncbi:5-formyltetrahydrofolate cyclo-ligase [Cellvibrio japonicus]|uniref:5-formyltetrahydrofolate cyclo-ligase n=1 Tax=Cellvibrio japonicus (strain Ueda107) TaxID=498211 RepID=B3PH92_CELJU|nr:5-formyltetrahydrofolate cyclo-ligase [Cellvibrio japonicus]ACE83671.1 5-formyltetrahydrofolate cyclo-ligase family protein [Cellvibrio japonicus Ueda107]QEI11013.1 5-formyltetrahydrofolate cyclo-ligase [Cellvibrio japonicus]QEI14588.1 5-formyltetrahydrofolate cyclo-ligase [Cellvibrio japonicus]QEI18167.1 5-formyltetrahydrofolate cyclo-ligase [Cellvibrio japonicus]